MNKTEAWKVIDQVISQVNATREQHTQLQMAMEALKPDEKATK